jgi:Arm DNA-binding domain
MANQAISIRTIEATRPLPGRDVYTWDTGLRGFGLRVTPKGVKSYVLQYRVNGGPARRKTIGIHGSPWTTLTARKEAERLLMLVRQGVDPVEAQREAKRRDKALNFANYCDQFVELYLQANWPDTWPEAMRTLENVAKPRWGKKPLHALKRSDMVKLMDDYGDRPGRRKYVHSLLRKLFNWAVDRQDIEISPLAGMKAPKSTASRRRVLGQEELICLWEATEQAGWPYALNAHMAQGLTSDRGIAVMDSRERNLTNRQTFLVTITRLRDHLTLIVDNSDRIERALMVNDGSKTSALEVTERLKSAAAQGLAKEPATKTGPEIGPEIGTADGKATPELSRTRTRGISL